MMVIDTKSKSIEDNIRKLENLLQGYMTETNKKLQSNCTKIDDLAQDLDVLWKNSFVVVMEFWEWS